MTTARQTAQPVALRGLTPKTMRLSSGANAIGLVASYCRGWAFGIDAQITCEVQNLGTVMPSSIAI